MRPRNPFPGVTRVVDRHGKIRWRFRMKGKPSCYIAGVYGSKEFVSNYQKAVDGQDQPIAASRLPAHGTFDWLIVEYQRTPTWHNLAPITKRNLGNEIERFRRRFGKAMVRDLRLDHIERILGDMADRPAAANKLLKLIRRLCRYAMRRELIVRDPSAGAKPYTLDGDGYHTWTDAEIAQFEAHHGVTSKAVLAMRLILCTGAAREDAAALGRQNIKDGPDGPRIVYRRIKTKQEVDIPIIDELAEVLAHVASDQMLFVTHGSGKGYTPESFGNWFREQCVAAELGHCSSHGLRKAGATRLANAEATEFEVMAFLGHRTTNEARTYVKRASRGKLTDSAFRKLRDVSNPVERLDNHRRKALKAKKEQK